MVEFLNLPIVLAAGQFILGYILKKWPSFPNKFIPIATYVLALFGFSVAPAEANAAGLLDSLVGGGGIFLAALGQNLTVTGIHGTWKNTLTPALVFTAKSIFGRWIR